VITVGDRDKRLAFVRAFNLQSSNLSVVCVAHSRACRAAAAAAAVVVVVHTELLQTGRVCSCSDRIPLMYLEHTVQGTLTKKRADVTLILLQPRQLSRYSDRLV
jgi:hypothetical protein